MDNLENINVYQDPCNDKMTNERSEPNPYDDLHVSSEPLSIMANAVPHRQNAHCPPITAYLILLLMLLLFLPPFPAFATDQGVIQDGSQ